MGNAIRGGCGDRGGGYTVKVNSLFWSLQGEGKLSGVPMAFIRLQGCNNFAKPCTYCDTRGSLDPELGLSYTPESIVEHVRKRKTEWVCITGGEPLIQPDLYEMVCGLLRSHRRITIETNGGCPLPSWYKDIESWVVDIKTPSSGVENRYGGKWFYHLGGGESLHQFKFVVGLEEDLEFVLSFMRGYRADRANVIISPIINGSLPLSGFVQQTIEFCLENDFRFSVQLHKLLGIP